MALKKLSSRDLNTQPAGRPKKDYVDFLASLRSGEGGRATTAGEKATKQTIKNRLNVAAKHAGVKITFLRTPPEEVRFRIER